MGGCRCTYGTCTSKSDGQTHMFHYPVFDKVRCHQWLMNARRLDFLNLKVSQLKNRVVCQHHFKDDNFMNFKKDKLTFDAVPTEDGPFCTLQKESNLSLAENPGKVYPMILDDIENDYLTCNDKKARFSVKYADFLTNFEYADFDYLNRNIDNKTKNITEDLNILDINEDHKNLNIENEPYINILIEPNMQNPDAPPHIVTLPGVPNFDGIYEKTPFTENLNYETKIGSQQQVPKEPVKPIKKNKVKILSEKKLTGPVPITGKLEPVSPSLIIRAPNRQKNLKTIEVKYEPGLQSEIVLQDLPVVQDLPIVQDQMVLQDQQILQDQPVLQDQSVSQSQMVLKQSVLQNQPISQNQPVLQKQSLLKSQNQLKFKPLIKNKSELQKPVLQNEPTSHIKRIISTPKNKKINTGKKPTVVVMKHNATPNSSIPKTKMSPERVAAIEKKRKYNMKLRDIIESCLDKLNEPQKIIENPADIQEQTKEQDVSTDLAKSYELPSVQEYTMTYLETRMKKMEDVLLSKIEQNSQRIIDLKQVIQPTSKRKRETKKSVSTQTLETEQMYKKFLYQEISKHLSAEANSLIYEELFINKHVQPAKKRKCR